MYIHICFKSMLQDLVCYANDAAISYWMHTITWHLSQADSLAAVLSSWCLRLLSAEKPMHNHTGMQEDEEDDVGRWCSICIYKILESMWWPAYVASLLIIDLSANCYIAYCYMLPRACSCLTYHKPIWQPATVSTMMGLHSWLHGSQGANNECKNCGSTGLLNLPEISCFEQAALSTLDLTYKSGETRLALHAPSSSWAGKRYHCYYHYIQACHQDRMVHSYQSSHFLTANVTVHMCQCNVAISLCLMWQCKTHGHPNLQLRGSCVDLVCFFHMGLHNICCLLLLLLLQQLVQPFLQHLLYLAWLCFDASLQWLNLPFPFICCFQSFCSSIRVFTNRFGCALIFGWCVFNDCHFQAYRTATSDVHCRGGVESSQQWCKVITRSNSNAQYTHYQHSILQQCVKHVPSTTSSSWRWTSWTRSCTSSWNGSQIDSMPGARGKNTCSQSLIAHKLACTQLTAASADGSCMMLCGMGCSSNVFLPITTHAVLEAHCARCSVFALCVAQAWGTLYA